MKLINATRDEIIEMLQKGEIVFASATREEFSVGLGIVLNICGTWFCNSKREAYEALGDYGREASCWFVEYSEKEKFEFQVGDVCSFGGVNGTIEFVFRDLEYPIVFAMSEGVNGHSYFFTIDGKYHREHTEPLLKFISRPSKKVKKTVELKRYTILGEAGGVYQTSWVTGEYKRMPSHLKIIKTETKAIEYEAEE